MSTAIEPPALPVAPVALGADGGGAERRLAIALRALGGLLLGAALVYFAGAWVGPAQDFFREPPFVANSAVKVTILGLLCVYASANLRRRAGLVVIVIAAHAVSLAAMGAVLAFGQTGDSVDLGFAQPTVATLLWGAIGLDGAITAIVAALFVAARPTLPRPERAPAELTAAESRTRALLVGLATLFALGASGYATLPFLATTQDLAVELPFVTNSVVKVSALALLCGYVAADMRANLALLGPVIVVHFVSVAIALFYLAVLDVGYARPLLGGEVEMSALLWGAVALDGVLAVGLLVAYRASWRARYGLRFLQPLEYRGLIALADVLVAGEPRAVPPQDVAANVEAYLRDVRAKRRWVYRVALFAVQMRPTLKLRPPLSEMQATRRRALLESRFQRPVQWWRFLKNLTQVMIRICQQLVYAGYYNDPRAQAAIGYRPFSQRERFQKLTPPDPGPHPLEVMRPENIGVLEIEADVCVVGSGAAGAILAYELARAGHSVLVVEKGLYVEPRDFNENEVDMISKLYADGVIQQTEDWRFTVLQGSCVGGSTTVNNAVCFPPPEKVLAHWNDPAVHDAGLDVERLQASVRAVEGFLSVAPQTGAPLNPSAGKFLAGARGRADLDVGVVRANIKDCLGCGYCNMGCKWGRKLSMLDTALPWAQRDFPGRVRIVAECEVERIQPLSGRPKRVQHLRARLSDGRRLTIRAQRYVLSAGAVASPYLLLRGGAGRGLPVGRKASFNMGSPLSAEFDEPLNAYDGLQISHYGIPRQNGFVLETWFNPPVAQALNMPGWFEQHFENMRRYEHLMAVGVLVGTASNARVIRGLTGGAGIKYTPEKKDLATLARGLKLLGELLFEAGAKRVMVNTWGYDEFTRPDQLGAIDAIAMDPDYITLGTGHPQGGNAISRDPHKGVVGPDFRVHGYENLFVCDASVFPSSLTVNPQLTVMALAHYASRAIA